jgi:hypothetical protein
LNYSLNNLGYDSLIYNDRYFLGYHLRKEENFYGIIKTNGFHNCCMIPILDSRDYWRELFDLSIGVINDFDKKYAYRYLKNNLKSYINNPNNVQQNLKPIVNFKDNEKKIILDFFKKVIKFWNIVILPNSLEDNMKDILKKNYPILKKYDDEEKLFYHAKKILKISEKDDKIFIEKCTDLFEEEKWYEDFIYKLIDSIE